MTSSKNKRLAYLMVLIVFFMVALTFASVPLYRIFCQVTGFGGVPKRVSALATTEVDRSVTVLFDANVDPSLPWDFKPKIPSVKLHLGKPEVVYYRVHNRGERSLTGTAVFNVQPDKAGPYFAKIQCFCFTEQTLAAGASADLPVQFYIDPAMALDRNTKDVENITLSYTFFLAKDPKAAHSVRK